MRQDDLVGGKGAAPRAAVERSLQPGRAVSPKTGRAFLGVEARHLFSVSSEWPRIFRLSRRQIGSGSQPVALALAQHMLMPKSLHLLRSAPGARHLEAMAAFRRET